MKKFLSLVLALVMTMSLVTVSAGAAYTDADKVNYNEAIDVMSKIGVISGYEDGSINPQGALTRGAAAKIICNLILGPTDAAALAVTEAPYKDVPANSTFAGYIAYCKSAGYVSGYADGTFKPGATLTGYAFMKMLLGTLGLDSAIEEYTGSNWAVNVAKRALQIGLDDGLNGTFNGTKGVNREEAMLFAFNALQAKTFTYDSKGSNINVGGVVINTGASEASQKTNGSDNDTLMYKLFGSKLTKDDVRDDFGRPATKWTYKYKTIGTYADEPEVTYTTKTKLGVIYDDLGLSQTTGFAYYQNTGVGNNVASVAKNDKTNYYGGNGVVLEVYTNSAHDENTIVEIGSFIGKITEVAKDADGERFVLTNAASPAGKKLYTDDFAKNDYIVMTYASGTTDDEIQSAYKVEKQSGTVTKKVGNTTIYIDGVAYDAYSGVTFSGLSVKDKVDFYCDQYGYIIKIDATSSTISTDNLAWAITNAASDRDGYYVKMIKAGDKKATTVTTDASYSYQNKIVKYTLDGDEYELMDIGFYYGNYYGYTSGAATLQLSTSQNVSLDGETLFMFVNDKNEATCYTGIKNAPNFSKTNGSDTVAIAEKDGVATLVVVTGVTTSSSASDLTFIIRDADAEKVVEDGKTYYTYKTLVNGKVGTIDVNTDAMFDGVDTSVYYDNYVVAVKSFSVSSKGVSTISELAPEATTSGIKLVSTVKAPKNGVIVLGGVSYALADDCAVYTVSKDGEIGTSADLDTIVDQTSGHLHYSGILASFNDKGKVDTIILSSVH